MLTTKVRRLLETQIREALGFLSLDPARLSDAEARGWLERFRQMEGTPAGLEVHGAEWARTDLNQPVAVADTLRHIHTHLAQGLRAVLQPGGEWVLPLGRSRIVGVRTQQRPVRRSFRVIADMAGEAENVIANVAGWITLVGETLRECPRCRTIFLGRKQGIYCGRGCQRDEMVARQTAKRRHERRNPKRRLTPLQKKGR